MNEPTKTAPKFKAEMPAIPGVVKSETQSVMPQHSAYPPRMWTILVVAAFLVSAVTGAWWILHGRNGGAAPPPPVNAAAAPAAAQPPVDALPDPPPASPANEIGKVSEFPKAWDSKKFTYSQPVTHEQVPAMIVRLPGGSERSPATYWGLLLQTPFGRCQLQYVSDVKAISKQFGVDANHPMIIDPCDGSVYDPLRMGTLADGSWARGELVRGNGGRPPLGIEVHLKGDELVAGRAED
jgi:hypothetical protein